MRRTEAINICWHHLSQSDEHGSLARSKAALKILVFRRIRNSTSDLCESRRPQLIPKPNQGGEGAACESCPERTVEFHVSPNALAAFVPGPDPS